MSELQALSHAAVVPCDDAVVWARCGEQQVGGYADLVVYVFTETTIV